MESTRIQTDATERIECLILDGALSPLTGLTDILISIRRISDGFWYDFADDTFKNFGWTTRQLAMTETDSSNDPGVYHYDFDTSAIAYAVADDTYQIRVDQSPGTSAKNVPQVGELKVGDFIDHIDADISSRAPANEYDAALTAIQADLDNPSQYQADVSALAVEANIEGHVATVLATYDPPTKADLDAAETNIITEVNANETKIDAIQVTLTGLGSDLEFIKDIEGGRWQLTGTQMIFFKDDNSTEVARFDITLDGNDNPIERTRV
jgi:hypothetical protein